MRLRNCNQLIITDFLRQWYPLSSNYKLVTIPQSHVYGALNWLVDNGYLEKKQFDETNPYCRCKLFKLTDKFYELLKGVN